LCFDKGNLSPKAMGEIDRTNLKFIASLRNSTQKDLLHIPHTQFETITLPISKKPVKYWRIQREVYGSARMLYVVIDPAKQIKHQQQFQRKFDDKIAEIQNFTRTQVNVKKWREKANVEAKLRTLIGKKPWKEIIAFTVEGEYAKLQVQLTINPTTKAAYEETLGRSILFTNQDSWKPEDVIWGYREQYLIEHAFRAMKDPRTIAIRPIYHANGKCIDAHIFVCLLALFLLSILRLKLSKRGIILTYDQIISQLRRIHATQIKVTPTKDVCYKLEKIPINTIKLVKLLHLDQLIQED
jgi:transposase